MLESLESGQLAVTTKKHAAKCGGETNRSAPPRHHYHLLVPAGNALQLYISAESVAGRQGLISMRTELGVVLIRERGEGGGMYGPFSVAERGALLLQQ